MWFLLGVTIAALGALLAEASVVRRWAGKIPIRIHVNGTRGKSSVATYIAAALRADGRRVLCKVTGILPTIILPDGSRIRLPRRGPARIQEQISLLRRARSLRCDAIVVECMAVDPMLQRFERRMIVPTIAVLTNIRDDHREVQGTTETERISGFLSWIPEECVVVSGETGKEEAVAGEVRRKSSRLVGVDPADLTSWEGGRVLPSNAALAFAVSLEAGCEPANARAAILSEAERIGRQDFPEWIDGSGATFLNGFAVNDTPSLEEFIAHWESRKGPWGRRVFILNTRSDRPLRTKSLVEWIARRRDASRIIITGTHRRAAARWLRSASVPGQEVTVWSRSDARRAGEILRQPEFTRGTVIIGIGNIAGDGFRILEGVAAWSSNLS